MKRLVLAVTLLVASSSVLANSITDAVKENAWPEYKCVIDVNGKSTETITNQEQYQSYSIEYGQELFEYVIENATLILTIDKPGKDGKRSAMALLYNVQNNSIKASIVGKFKGYCQ